MENNQQWKEFCFHVNKYIESGEKEEASFHDLLIDILKHTFKWPPCYIKKDAPVKNGSSLSYADIVLEGDGYGIIIEVKSPHLPIEESDRKWLKSYLKNYRNSGDGSRCEYGLLIGNRIEAYYLDKTNETEKSTVIYGYNADSKLGNIFGKALFFYGD